MKILSIEAKLENLTQVMDFINANIVECIPKIQNQINIAVDEIFSNIAKYAYRPEKGSVTVRIMVDDLIRIEFEDKGFAYNPLDIETPDTSLSVSERDVGGLGVLLVKNLMDSVHYKRIGDKNILEIQKKI